ncbi:MAG TPA: hypothetical protein VNJ51_01335 [Candidatus Dormibacteraeota bacterium]|nr:hypothetical protein [Candidatus Dormibacteraeota bacterium]
MWNKQGDVDVRLVQLLSSYIETAGEYALARLELAIAQPRAALPPHLPRPSGASEAALRGDWPASERALEAAVEYLRRVGRGRLDVDRKHAAYGWVERCIRELDQYGRCIRWVLTVSERERP